MPRYTKWSVSSRFPTKILYAFRLAPGALPSAPNSSSFNRLTFYHIRRNLWTGVLSTSSRGTQNSAQTRTHARYRKQHRSTRPIFNTNFRNSKQKSVWRNLKTWVTNAWRKVAGRWDTRNALMWRGRSIAEMGPICVGVATTKCNALREVGEMNLVERKGLVARSAQDRFLASQIGSTAGHNLQFSPRIQNHATSCKQPRSKEDSYCCCLHDAISSYCGISGRQAECYRSVLHWHCHTWNWLRTS